MSIVNSRNLFIDTSTDTNNTRGDNVTLQLGKDSIHAGSGQQLRLTLSYFSMYKNYYQININNSAVTVRTNGGVTDIHIPESNYRNLGQIVAAFANQALAPVLLAHAVAANSQASTTTVEVVEPQPTFALDYGNRILYFRVKFNAPHNLTSCVLQCYATHGESYEILGGNRINDPLDSSTSSLNVSIASTTEIIFEGYYPMQRSTDSHICLRCDLPNTNVETSSLSRATGPYNTQTLRSNIVAMIPVDTEYTSFTSSTDNEFFLYLTTQNLSSMKLFLTDQKNRPLSRVAGSGSQTAAGTGGFQSTLGNLSFRAIIRIDVIQQMIPQTLKTKPVEHTIPARKTGILPGLTNC